MFFIKGRPRLCLQIGILGLSTSQSKKIILNRSVAKITIGDHAHEVRAKAKETVKLTRIMAGEIIRTIKTPTKRNLKI